MEPPVGEHVAGARSTSTSPVVQTTVPARCAIGAGSAEPRPTVPRRLRLRNSVSQYASQRSYGVPVADSLWYAAVFR